ncbi:hypothetical protein GS901_04455 [Rhodococcus hoagii]|nr:hypothetical protein [Prescottella equi]
MTPRDVFDRRTVAALAAVAMSDGAAGESLAELDGAASAMYRSLRSWRGWCGAPVAGSAASRNRCC